MTPFLLSPRLGALASTFLFSSLLFNALGQTSQVVLRGHLPGFRPASEHLYFTAQAYPAAQHEAVFARIADQGDFTLTVDLDHPAQVDLGYHGKTFPFLVVPGDHVVLRFDTSRAIVAVSGGQHEACNQILQRHFAQLNQCVKGTDTGLDLEAFRTARLQQLKTDQQRVDSLFDQDCIEEPLSRAFIQADLQQIALNELLKQPFSGGINTSAHDTLPYFQMLVKMANEPPFFGGYTAFYHKNLELLYGDWGIMRNLNPTYAAARKAQAGTQEACFIRYEQTLQQYNRLPAGAVRRYLLERLWKESQNCNTFYTFYQDTIRHLLGGQAPLNTPSTAVREKDVFKLIAAFEAPDSIKQQLRTLFTSLLGQPRVLFFWDENCSNVPYYYEALQQVQALTSHESVAFLGVKMTAAQYHAVLPTHPFMKTHFYLNATQEVFFQQFFQAVATPHWSLIDAQGQVVAPAYNLYNVEKTAQYLNNK